MSKKKTILLILSGMFAFLVTMGFLGSVLLGSEYQAKTNQEILVNPEHVNQTIPVLEKLSLPYSWTENNFKYTLVSFGGGLPESKFDETLKYGVEIDCQNLLKSNNEGSFQAIHDIKLKTDIGYTWDLKFRFGLNVCHDKFDPEELKSRGSYFEIGKNEKPDVLLVSTYTGEQLIFDVSK